VFGMEIIWGSIDGVGIKEIDGIVDGGDEMEGAEEELGIKETDGDVDGTPRSGSHGMLIFLGSKYASHRAYTLGFQPVLKMDNLQ